MSHTRLNRPFVIWTLQRTGGTNLNACLNSLSDCLWLEDEAFNSDRSCGYVTDIWSKTKDAHALQQAVDEVCDRRGNLKHCPELVPWPVSKALVAAAVARGYSHLFLYRANAVERILSREYAWRTRVWGPRQARQRIPADLPDAFRLPLDIDTIVKHETMANTRLNRIWHSLLQDGQLPVAISFEELYATDPTTTRDALHRVFSGLGLTLSADQTEEIRLAMQTRGNQNTRDRYSRFEGIDQLRQRISKIPALTFRT